MLSTVWFIPFVVNIDLLRTDISERPVVSVTVGFGIVVRTVDHIYDTHFISFLLAAGLPWCCDFLFEN